MKRPANLVPQITDLNNLYAAYMLASRGKKHKFEVVHYASDLYTNLQCLQKQIMAGQLDIGHYHSFTIYEPKKRIICAASFPERVLHHAIMRICHPVFEKHLIYDSYATRINKGTYKAIKRAAYFNRKNKYYMKLDVRKYFDSISHLIIKKQLARLFNDAHLLHILGQINAGYCLTENMGLPIGNLTSQYFANHYLSGFDHFIKEKLRAKSYVRYMDDMVLWANEADTLHYYLQEINDFMFKNLFLELKPAIINTTGHGLSFLSYRLFNTHIELQQKSKKRFIQKHKKYVVYLEEKKWSEEEFCRHLLPLMAFTEHASAKGFRKMVANKEGLY